LYITNNVVFRNLLIIKMSDEEYEVEKILEKRTNKGRQIEYLVKWKTTMTQMTIHGSQLIILKRPRRSSRNTRRILMPRAPLQLKLLLTSGSLQLVARKTKPKSQRLKLKVKFHKVYRNIE